MRKLVLLILVAAFVFATAGEAFARIKYISPYVRSDGTYVNGHYRDTSNDGYEGNNANYLGYNDW
ncbi:MAG: hypothetical protein CMB80_02990 [Flammeovirgaceae bacterium]|nr:hypothetical protein [Flammeovirgaceae bacterium]|tara:strand:+ start:998 stop:1192 length:195 start_codon:yes stop_codon:yes gene_type:complete